MNANTFIKYELEFHLNDPYIPIEEEIIGLLDIIGDAIDNEPIEEANNVQIGDVPEEKVRFKDLESVLETLKQILEQKPIYVTPLI